MPTPTEIFNKTLDKNTLARLQSEDAAALQIFRILDATRAELYTRLRDFEDRIGEGAEARYSSIVLAQTIHEINLTFAKMDATISPAFRAQLQAGYTEGQRQTYAEVAAFERLTPGFPETFKPVTPTDAVLQFMDGQNATMTRLNDGLRARVIQEIQRVQPNISDAEALQAAGAGAERIKEAISRGILSGDGTKSIARRLADPDGEFPRLANNTVMRTVRLGINESFNHGHEETIREAAKVVTGLGKAWLAALKRSTKICLDLHGQKCGVGESFEVQGRQVVRPPAIGSGLSPAFHLCRSRVVPWNSKWPPNPKLDELTKDEKDHFLSGGGKTDKQKGPGPLATQGAKEALAERAKQLREKLDAEKAAKEAKLKADAYLKDLAEKKRAEKAILARTKLIAQEKARLAKAANLEKLAADKDAFDAAKAAEAAKAEAAKAEAAKAADAAKAKAKLDAMAAARKAKAAAGGLKEFKDQADLDDWAKRAYNLEDSPLMPADRAAILDWQTPHKYREIQAGLRDSNNLGLKDPSGKVYTPAELREKYKETVQDLDNLLGWHAAKEDFKTFRGFHGAPPIEKLKAAVGGYYTDGGYTATSPIGSVAERFSKPTVNLDAPRAVMELRVPKGTPNFYVNLVNDIKEAEILLGRGLELRVISHEMRGDINYFVVDVLTPAESLAKKEAEALAQAAAPKKRGRPPGSKNKPKVAYKYGLSRPETDFRNFNNSKTACDVWGLKRYSVAGYTSKQINALEFYQGSGYLGMNAGLRGLDLYGESAASLLRRNADEIAALDSVMNEKPLDKPQYVVRGTDFAPLKAQILANIGGEFYDPAYMSTAVVKEVSERGFAHVYPDPSDPEADYRTNEGSLMWRMYMPEGTPAFYLNALKDIGEAEILIGRGMRYRILAHEVIQGVDWVTVEGLPYEQPK